MFLRQIIQSHLLFCNKMEINERGIEFVDELAVLLSKEINSGLDLTHLH